MAKICVELSDLVILGGIVSIGFLVFDHANNDGKILAQIKHFYKEVKQSVFNGDKQSKCVANKATFKAGRSNDGKKKMCSDGGQKLTDVVRRNCVERIVLISRLTFVLFEFLNYNFVQRLFYSINRLINSTKTSVYYL